MSGRKRRFHFLKWVGRRKNSLNGQRQEEHFLNPYLPYLREIVEHILKKRKIPYERFMPILIDGEKSQDSLDAIRQLSRDLNRLIILTNQAAYFEKESERLYEEQGLIVEIFQKTQDKIVALQSEDMQGNVILDFEKPKERIEEIKFGKKIYIPIFKKKWESAGNLDITVPIGYNTVIVKGIGTERKQLCLDKFERAFYENE